MYNLYTFIIYTPFVRGKSFLKFSEELWQKYFIIPLTPSMTIIRVC